MEKDAHAADGNGGMEGEVGGAGEGAGRGRYAYWHRFTGDVRVGCRSVSGHITVSFYGGIRECELGSLLMGEEGFRVCFVGERCLVASG
jgi:hypothetical protein